MVHKNERVYSDSNVSSVRSGPSAINIRLEDRDLWMRFFGKTNEMIVTRSGRNMFPVIKVGLSGLDPTTIYEVVVDFQQINNHKWKYINGEWQQGTKPDPVQLKCEYKHPDSPNFGAHWMKDSLSFNKVKLTNKPPNKGQIQLNSLHKYEPRIVIYRLNTNLREKVAEASFHETQFIAVTAYQNEEITSLKIRHNPFAKAFLDVRDTRPERDQNGQDDYIDDQNSAYTNSGNIYNYNAILSGSSSLVTVASAQQQQQQQQQHNSGSNNTLQTTSASSISSSTSASPDYYNNRPHLNLATYSLPCPQNQHSGGTVDRYSRHSSNRCTPYSSGYYGHTHHQQSTPQTILNYSQETEVNVGNQNLVIASPPLIMASQFSTSTLSPRSNLLLPSAGTLQTPTQIGIDSTANTFDTWSSSASTSSTSSQKNNDSILNASSPNATSSSNSSPISSINSAQSQFFNPTTSSSPLNQQNIVYNDMSQVYHHQHQQQQNVNKYWSSNYNSSYISNQFNQHHHNYALAALAAANYHPQLSISPLNQLSQNTSSLENSGISLKSEQFSSNASPTNQFYNETTNGNNTNSNQGSKLQF